MTSSEPPRSKWDPTRLHAESPAEFAALLRYILEGSELTAGQVAVKAGIPRSQAYSLIKPSRTTLPAKQEQVANFITACGLTEMQRDIVLHRYQQLQREQQERSDRKEAKAVMAAGDPLLRRDDIGAETLARMTATVVEPSSHKKLRVRHSGFYDFLGYVLASETRVRHLLWLLYPLVALLVGVFVLLGVIVWANPSLGPQVLTGIGGAGALGAMTLYARAIRRR